MGAIEYRWDELNHDRHGAKGDLGWVMAVSIDEKGV